MDLKAILVKIAQPLAFTGCALSFGYFYLIRKNKDKHIMYRDIVKINNKACFCDETIRKLLFDVGSKMNIPEDRLKSIALYYQLSNYPSSCGRFDSRSIPGIGLPYVYKYKFFEETTFDNIGIFGKHLGMTSDSPEGVALRQSLFLTEDAKKFVIARNLHYLQCYYYEVEHAISILSLYTLFQVAYFIKITNPSTGTLDIFRVAVVAFLCIVVYFVQRELFQSYLSNMCYTADREAAKIAPRYYSGGIEFYSKTIKLNKILHEAGFTKQFNKIGNENTGFLFNYSWITCHSRLHNLLNLHKQ